jgi:hypothetical protein
MAALGHPMAGGLLSYQIEPIHLPVKHVYLAILISVSMAFTRILDHSHSWMPVHFHSPMQLQTLLPEKLLIFLE